jgi:hypothetical protein
MMSPRWNRSRSRVVNALASISISMHDARSRASRSLNIVLASVYACVSLAASRRCFLSNNHEHAHPHINRARLSMRLNVREELLPRLRIRLEAPEHAARDGLRTSFLHSAHDHAHVRGLHDDRDTLRLDRGGNRLGDLLRQALLDLQATGEHVGDASELRQTGNTENGRKHDQRGSRREFEATGVTACTTDPSTFPFGTYPI